MTLRDNAPNDIAIGGTLPAALLHEFLDKIVSIGVKTGGRDGTAFSANTVEQLSQALNESGHLVLVADQDTQLNDLGDFCVRHGMGFDRRATTRNLYFRPGMQRPTQPDMGGEALYDADNIRPLAKELAKLLSIKLTREKLLAATVKVVRQLHGLLPPEVEPLPPLEIKE